MFSITQVKGAPVVLFLSLFFPKSSDWTRAFKIACFFSSGRRRCKKSCSILQLLGRGPPQFGLVRMLVEFFEEPPADFRMLLISSQQSVRVLVYMWVAALSLQVPPASGPGTEADSVSIFKMEMKLFLLGESTHSGLSQLPP